MAASMVGRASFSVLRKLQIRAIYTQRHVVTRHPINSVTIAHRIHSLCAGLHSSSLSRLAEIPKVDENVSQCVEETLTDTATPTTPPINLQELLSDMRYSLEKQQRVRPWCVEQVLDTLTSDPGVSVSESSWALLLRSCGNALLNSPIAERQTLLERTVNLMRQKDITFSAEHHNAVLQSRLENKEELLLSRYLSEMAGENIAVDSRTYHLVISSFCEQGHIDTALQLLDNIEQSSDSVHERVYTPLITAYMEKGERENALGIVARMEEHGASVSTDSLKRLMMGYAASGDMAGIKDVLRMASSKAVSIDPYSILSVINVIEANNDNKMLPEMTDVLAGILQHPQYEHETVNVIYQLKSKNESASLELFALLEPNLTSRELISFLDRLLISKESGYHFTLQILQLLLEKKRMFRMHETGSVVKLLSMLHHADCVKLWAALLALCNTEEISQHVPAVNEEVIGNGDKKFLDFISLGHFERGIGFAERNSVTMLRFQSSLTRALLRGFVKSGRDCQGVAWALKQCALLSGLPLVKVNSDVLFVILEDPRTSVDEVKMLLKAAWQNDVKLLDEYVVMAMRKARLLEHKEFVERWAMDLTVHIPTRAEMLTMTSSQLHALLHNLQLMGVESVDALEISLEKHTTDESAESLKQALDALYLREAREKLERSGMAAMHFRQQPAEAEQYLEVFQRHFPAYSTASFRLCTAVCQAENELLDEAVKTVSLMENQKTEGKMLRCSDEFFLRFAVDIPLLHDLLLKFERLDGVCDMVQLLWEKGIVDDTGVLRYVVRQNYKRWRFSVLDSMFRNDVHDTLADKLFTVKHDPTLENATENRGLMEAQFLFYRTLVEEGQMEGIKRCLENPNFCPSHRVLSEVCVWLHGAGDDAALEELLAHVALIPGLHMHTLIAYVTKTIPAQQLANSVFSNYANVQDLDSGQLATNKNLQRRNEALVAFLETQQKPIDLATIKTHVSKLARNNLWLEFVDFVCALRNKSSHKELMFIATLVSKPHWVTYVLKQVMRMETENGNYAQLEAFIKKVKSNRSWSKLQFIHLPSLLKLQEEKADVACVLEEHMVLQAKQTPSAAVQLLILYLKIGRLDEVERLLRSNRSLRENLRPSVISNSLDGSALWTDEKQVLKLLSVEVARRGELCAVVYDQLIRLMCQAGNWQAASNYYNEAVDDGVQLQQLRRDTLMALQTLLRENDRPVPWPTSLSQILMSRKQ